MELFIAYLILVYVFVTLTDESAAKIYAELDAENRRLAAELADARADLLVAEWRPLFDADIGELVREIEERSREKMMLCGQIGTLTAERDHWQQMALGRNQLPSLRVDVIAEHDMNEWLIKWQGATE